MNGLVHINRMKARKAVLVIVAIICIIFPGAVSAVSGPAAEIGLTRAEREWPRAHPRIRIGVDPAYAPYSFCDREGRCRGVAMDFTQYIGERLGIVMEAAPYASWPEIVAGVRERSLDVVLTMSHRPEREAFIEFTEIYLPTPLVIIRRRGDARVQSKTDLDALTAAMVEGYASSARVMEEHPGAARLMVKTPLEGLLAVATGKADALVGALGVNLHLIRENSIINLEAASLYDDGAHGQRFGVRKDWPLLASILDKVLATMPAEHKRRLFERWLPGRVARELFARQTPPHQGLVLTPAEKEWLAGRMRIEIGVMNQWPPFDFVDRDNRPRGIGVDFIEALNKRLGGVLAPVPGAWLDIYGAVKEKRL
ncbi:MAG: transporter substrate-binding domain-containing protein, partial [Desulfobacterales bacterium]|nr:transporter substrate-binding domain-containing protein [Desulfobacterales bacterium]